MFNFFLKSSDLFVQVIPLLSQNRTDFIFSGVYLEKVLKSSNASIWVQNIRLALIGLPISFLSMWYYDWEKINERELLIVLSKPGFEFRKKTFKLKKVGCKEVSMKPERSSVVAWEVYSCVLSVSSIKKRKEMDPLHPFRAHCQFSFLFTPLEKADNPMEGTEPEHMLAPPAFCLHTDHCLLLCMWAWRKESFCIRCIKCFKTVADE